jgi:hypothetical protein
LFDRSLAVRSLSSGASRPTSGMPAATAREHARLRGCGADERTSTLAFGLTWSRSKNYQSRGRRQRGSSADRRQRCPASRP